MIRAVTWAVSVLKETSFYSQRHTVRNSKDVLENTENYSMPSQGMPWSKSLALVLIRIIVCRLLRKEVLISNRVTAFASKQRALQSKKKGTVEKCVWDA